MRTSISDFNPPRDQLKLMLGHRLKNDPGGDDVQPVARMDADALPRRVLEGEPIGRRPPGRPKLRWRDCVRRDLELLDVPYPEMWMEHAQDRQWWRLLVAAAKGLDGRQLQE